MRQSQEANGAVCTGDATVFKSSNAQDTQTDIKTLDSGINLKSLEQTQDEEDHDSISTVLSHQSESSDESSSTSPAASVCPRQLDADFKARDELLEQLTIGIDPVYSRIMRANEMAARREKIRRARQQGSSNDNDKLQLMPQVGARNSGRNAIWERIQMTTACDWNNTTTAVAHLILYCIAHGSCFQVTEVFLSALTGGFEDQVVVAVALISLSIIVLRITGGMWHYLDDTSYGRVKFDMHNRLRLGMADALVARWFRRHEKLRRCFNMLAFYITFTHVSYLQERGIAALNLRVRALLDNLQILKGQLLSSGGTCAIGSLNGTEAELVEPAYSWYYAVSAIGAIFLLSRLGFSYGI